MGTKKGIVLGLILCATAFAGRVHAEPSYLLYPSSPAVCRFDAGRYELVSPGDARFDAAYAVGGQMLWDRAESRIPVELYRAPIITAFEPSPSGQNEYVTLGNNFDVIVDGFGTSPRTLGSLCLRFWPDPPSSLVQVFIDGAPIGALTSQLAPIEVLTSIGNGFYSDTGVHRFTWVGSTGLEIIAFSDKNANGAFEGTPRFRIVAQDNVVGVEATTWGGVKALYRK
ncbi:MAG: hypothetical protein OEX18_09410 [Candidatus Krumholzibacteria bacterium]|nr:hypothetical protein [Candidatus Krumholzibacteria bacterium]MDH4337474.1 hypothetical protein [Candidatus Krumholzibacteria bacterium]MDH5270146.1 hypothetical protein [Candidatus Krumholzibacteria bacterium]MDH5626849.1 hypothetical protein [Candidatus Krumholzibacteria bacterium]